MNNKYLALFIIFLFLIIFHSEAQVIDRYIRSKANVVTKRVFEKADEKVDSVLIDAVDKQMEKENNKVPDNKEERESSNTEKSATRFGPYPGRQNAGVEIPQSYNYQGYLLMEMEEWNEKGKKENSSLYKTFYSEDTKSFALEFSESGKNSIIIFDNNMPGMFILTDDGTEKSGIYMPLNRDDAESASESDNKTENNENVSSEISDINYFNSNFKKTGNKKNICGFSCDEYVWEDENEIFSYWITRELPSDLYSRIFSLNIFATAAFTGINQGFIMEWENRKKNSSERSIMTVKEVDKNKSSTINTTGYNLINLSNFNQ